MNNQDGSTTSIDRYHSFWSGKTTEEILSFIENRPEKEFSQEAIAAIELVLKERQIQFLCPDCRKPYRLFESSCAYCGMKLPRKINSEQPVDVDGAGDSPPGRGGFWAGVAISLLALFSTFLVLSLALRFDPVMDVFQIVSRKEYDQKTAEVEDLTKEVTSLNSKVATANATVVTLNSQLEEANNKVASLTTQLSNANAEIGRLKTDTQAINKYKSLICPESWNKLYSSTVWAFGEPYYSFMGKLGFQAVVTQWGTSKTLQKTGYTVVLLIDMYKTQSMVLNIDEDCVIVNPAWKTF